MKKLLFSLLLVTSISVVNALGQTVTVNATANPLWTDTGLHLNAGTQIILSVSGTWAFGGPGGGTNNGTGETPDPASWDKFYSGAPQGALIGYVGSNPFQGSFPAATGYFLVGTGATFTSTTAGELWLGCNDDANAGGTIDNFGSLTTQITVVPEPTPWGLGLAGTALVSVLRRKRF